MAYESGQEHVEEKCSVGKGSKQAGQGGHC